MKALLTEVGAPYPGRWHIKFTPPVPHVDDHDDSFCLLRAAIGTKRECFALAKEVGIKLNEIQRSTK